MAELTKKSMLSLADLYFLTDDDKVRLQWSNTLYLEKNTKPKMSDYDSDSWYDENGDYYVSVDNEYYAALGKYEYITEHMRSSALDCAYYVVEIYDMTTGKTTQTNKIYSNDVELDLAAGEYICQVKAYSSSGALLDSSGKNYVNTRILEEGFYDDFYISYEDCGAEFEIGNIGSYYGPINQNYYEDAYARLADAAEIRSSDGTSSRFMVCGPAQCGNEEAWAAAKRYGFDYSISNGYGGFDGEFSISGNIMLSNCGLYEYENGQWVYKAYLQPDFEVGECRSNANYLLNDDDESSLNKNIYYYDSATDTIKKHLTAAKQVYGISQNYYMTEDGVFSLNTNKQVLKYKVAYGEHLLYDDLMFNVYAVCNGKKCDDIEEGKNGSIVAEYYRFNSKTKQSELIGKYTLFNGRANLHEIESEEVFVERIGNCFCFSMGSNNNDNPYGYDLIIHVLEDGEIRQITKSYDQYPTIYAEDGNLMVESWKEVYDPEWGYTYEDVSETVYRNIDFSSYYQPDITLNGSASVEDDKNNWEDLKFFGASSSNVDHETVQEINREKINEIYEGTVSAADKVDYFEFTLQNAAALSFTVNADNAATFAVYQLTQDKKGNYSLKSLQSSALKKDKNTGKYYVDTKNLLLTADTYYIGVTNTDKKVDYDSGYDFTINGNSAFFDKGDNTDDWEDMKVRGAKGSFNKTAFEEPLSAENIYQFEDNWVGFGDGVDYFQITLEDAAKLSFTINAADSVKFTIYELKQGKKGTYSLKSLQSTTLKMDKNANISTVDTKTLLLQANTYYVAVQSTNANKGGNADYSFAINDSSYFFNQDSDGNNWEDMKFFGRWSDEYDVLEDIYESYSGFVGYGDEIDYMQFKVSRSQKLSFSVSATDAAQFVIYQLNENKNGTYSLKALQTSKLKQDSVTGFYYINTKELNLAAGTYYIGVKSTNAAKGGAAEYTFKANPAGVAAVNRTIGAKNYNSAYYRSIYGSVIDDTIKVTAKRIAIVDYLQLDEGNDKFTVEKDADCIISGIEMGSGDDVISVNSGDIETGYIDMGEGNNALIFNGGDLEYGFWDENYDWECEYNITISFGSGNDIMTLTKSANIEHYGKNFDIYFGEGNDTLLINKDSFFSACDTRSFGGEYSCNTIDWGSGNDCMEIASGTEMRLCGTDGILDFGDGYDTLILNGTLALNNASISGLENVIGSGQLLLGGDKDYNEEDFQQFIDAGIDVINTGTVCPFSSRAEELADNQFAKAAKFEKDGDMSQANIWVCSQEYADSVAFGFADEVDYVSFTKKANTSLYVENWSNVDGVCLEIYDKKENLLASYTGDDLIYRMIELNGIKNGTACVIKITVDDDSFYAGRIYQISM